MGYTVKDLLESNNFSEMQLISDDSGIGREIKGVRIIEVPDMEKFLHLRYRRPAPGHIKDLLFPARFVILVYKPCANFP